ncbi:MAG: tRNA (N6-threonylcarbamoyladenosine(37)-N6)-methyltransferase TrmO [Thermoproteota archaeon]
MSEEIGEIDIYKEYEQGLKDIELYSHIYVFYYFDRRIRESQKPGHHLKSYGLTVNPYMDDKIHGTFATRSPNRPNPLGMSILELISRNKNILKVKNVDMFGKTLVLDIKPYVTIFDVKKDVKDGWHGK